MKEEVVYQWVETNVNLHHWKTTQCKTQKFSKNQDNGQTLPL